MKHRLLPLACALLTTAAVHGQADVLGGLTENVNIEGLETQFDPVTGIATAKGDVHIIYGVVEIKSGQADYNTNTGEMESGDASPDSRVHMVMQPKSQQSKPAANADCTKAAAAATH